MVWILVNTRKITHNSQNIGSTFIYVLYIYYIYIYSYIWVNELMSYSIHSNYYDVRLTAENMRFPQNVVIHWWVIDELSTSEWVTDAGKQMLRPARGIVSLWFLVPDGMLSIVRSWIMVLQKWGRRGLVAGFEKYSYTDKYIYLYFSI